MSLYILELEKCDLNLMLLVAIDNARIIMVMMLASEEDRDDE